MKKEERGWFAFWREDKRRWVVKYKAGGVWKQAVCPAVVTREKDAEAWGAAFIAEKQATGQLARVAPAGGPTFNDKAEAWKAIRLARPGLRRSTVQDNGSHLKQHVLPAFGTTPIAAVTVADVRAFARTLRGKVLDRTGTAMAPLMVRNVIKTLVAFLDDAHAEGWVVMPHNPARDRAVALEMPPARRRSGKLVLHLTQAQAQALIDCPHVAGGRKVRYLLGCLAGLRDGEIAALRWSKVHLGAEVPHLDIDEAVSIKGPTGYATAGEVKSEASERLVPIHPSLLAALRWWKAEGWEIEHGRGAPGERDVLFRGRSRELARPRSAAHLRADLRRAEQPDHQEGHALTFHCLRHSFSSWLDEAGVDEPTIGALLGHEGRTVTRRSYTSAALARLAEAVRKLPLRWGAVAVVGGTKALGASPQTSTKRKPLETMRTMILNAIQGPSVPDGHRATPSPAPRSAFLNRRSCVQVASGAQRYRIVSSGLGASGTKRGTMGGGVRVAELVARTAWASLPLAAVAGQVPA